LQKDGKKYFEPKETSVIDIKEDLEVNDVSFNIVGENNEKDQKMNLKY